VGPVRPTDQGSHRNPLASCRGCAGQDLLWVQSARTEMIPIADLPHSDEAVSASEQEVFLRWPPPGLERMQGDLWRVASRGALGGGLLVLPILFVVAREQEFASLGPFADAWWLTIVLSTVGLGFVVEALATVARILRRVAQALERGYDWRTDRFVPADLRRDMGFLLQGSRHFGGLGLGERRAIAGLRLLAGSSHALAGLWLPVALCVGLLLASRNVMDAQTLWIGHVVAGRVVVSGRRVRGSGGGPSGPVRAPRVVLPTLGVGSGRGRDQRMAGGPRGA